LTIYQILKLYFSNAFCILNDFANYFCQNFPIFLE